MKQFSNILREYTTWLTSFRIANLLMPFHLHILFGGVGLLFLYKVILTQFHKYWNIFFTVGHYAFWAGVFLTLAAPNKKYLPYALWGYVFYTLFPFRTFSLYQVCESALYIFLGYWLFKYEARETLASSTDYSNTSD